MEAAREQHDLRSLDRCPFCHDAITTAKPTVACAACGARHHEACHQEHGACAACAATEALVPAAPSSARARREQPPKGSTITVTHDDDAITYAWPRFRHRAATLALVFLFAATVLLSPIALLLFFAWYGDEPLSVTLSPKRLRIVYAPSGALGRKEINVRRQDLGAVLLERNRGYLHLTVDVGVDRIPVASVATLKEPEIEWLHEALLAWKAEG